MPNITVNGQSQQIPDNTTVRDLLASLGLADRPVAVEVNKELIPRRMHASRWLQEGDRVEIVTLVGGG